MITYIGTLHSYLEAFSRIKLFFKSKFAQKYFDFVFMKGSKLFRTPIERKVDDLIFEEKIVVNSKLMK